MPSLMIVEDSPLIRDIYKTILQPLTDQGYRIVFANNGKEALILLDIKGEHPDLILLDLNMPVMGGMEFLKIRKTHPKLQAIPVVVCSSDKSQREAVLSMGVVWFKEKPINVKNLVEIIEGQIGG